MGKEKKTRKISRRKFIVRSALGGTAVILGTTYLARNPIRRKIAEFANSFEVPFMGNTEEPSLWFQVTRNNSIILNCPKVEMGQGTFTGLAQIAADELEVGIHQIKVMHAPTASGNIDGSSTGGSTSISSLWQPLRELAATMREMIKGEAAKKLGVKISTLTVINGIISAGDKSISYGEVVQDVNVWKIPEVPPLKKITDYKFVGKPVPRVDKSWENLYSGWTP